MIPPKVSIRRMTSADVLAVRPLIGQLGYYLELNEVKRRFATVEDSNDHAVFIAEVKGHVAGFLHVFARAALEKPPEAVVQALAVDASVRRGGIGKVMMAAAEDWAMQYGYESVALTTQIDRVDAHAFYDSLGYRNSATSHLLRKGIVG